MLEPVDAKSDMIPPQSGEEQRSTTKRAELGTITQHDSIEPDPATVTVSGAAGEDPTVSKMQKSSLLEAVPSEKQATIESSLRDPVEASAQQDAKTVTIDAS